MRNLTTSRNDLIRLIVLGILVILEGLALVSTALNIVFLPLGVVYPNVASAAILILPVAIGLASKRWELALVLTVLPFLVLAAVYTTRYAPIWNMDIFQLGVL